MVTITSLKEKPSKGIAMITWDNLANGDQGDWVDISKYTDLTIQFDGTFGIGGTIRLEGSNDANSAFTLTDPQDNSISVTAAALEQVLENPRFVRPNVTAGDGTTSLNARLKGRAW